MPVDPSKGTGTRRRIVSDEEVDIRRARGEISCAECRRLKLKCDKKLPCSSCIRRGCPSICPNGSLSTGQGTRFVLADTVHLHDKIAEMGQRIRQLEDALAIFQAGVSNETHPLLRDELLSIKFGPEKGQKPEKVQPPVDTTLIDALGTLTIGSRGEAKYFGRSGGSETLFLAGAEMEASASDEDEDTPHSSLDVARLARTFPFGLDVNLNTEKALDMLFTYLPPQARAWSLFETYLEQASWQFRPLQREEIVDEILTPIYKSVKQRHDTNYTEPHSVAPHKLAVLFLIFALGAIVDLTLPPSSVEAENFMHLGCAALSLRSIFDSPEIATVQAVALMAAFHGVGGRKYTMDSCWSLISLASKLAQSLGLHRDSARWDMDAKTVQRRRGLFWEVFSMELFHSLALGRPPGIRLSYIDCEFPDEDEELFDKDGNRLIGFYRWKYEFCQEVSMNVTELTLTAEAPSYQTVLDLDRKVREKYLPPHLNIYSSGEEYYTPGVYMRGCLLSQYRSITLLYIHRSFFAQAMLGHPGADPLLSPYAPSFLAAYRCASGVIKMNLTHHERFPELTQRWWVIWTHLFSAAIIVGSIVTRAPASSMAPSAFIELGLAVDLFKKGAPHSRRARSGLAILCKLRDKAFQVYSQFRSGNTQMMDLAPGRPDYDGDELAIFGGQTRVLVSKLLSRRTPAKRHSSGSVTSMHTSPTPSPADSEAQSPQSPSDLPEVHPSLVEYLSLFPQSQYLSTSPANLTATFPPAGSSEHINSYGSIPSMQHTYNQLGSTGQPPISSLPNWQSPSNSGSSRSSFDTPTQMGNGFQEPSTFAAANPVSMYHPLDGSADSPPDGSLMDLGMLMSGESGMDEQWLSFMRDSGILDASNGNNNAP